MPASVGWNLKSSILIVILCLEIGGLAAPQLCGGCPRVARDPRFRGCRREPPCKKQVFFFYRESGSPCGKAGGLVAAA